MPDKEIDDMVKAYVDNMPDMVLNSNGIMNWRVFFNEVAKKVAGAAYKDGINAAQEQMINKACEWLSNVSIEDMTYKYNDFDTSEGWYKFIEDFKNYMKGE